MDVDMSAQINAYRHRRDLVVSGLKEAGYRLAKPGGAFYVFPEVPAGGGTGTEFVARAIAHELLIIPGSVFSGRDTHFRISYAASEETIERGLAVLRRIGS
jgi:aspartate aminotransferase/aminotransferase